jgi:aminomethyltransferase
LTALKRTPLFDAHRAAGARMVEFGGWEMPVDYSGAGHGVIREHLAVRRAAGLFDVSHMGEFEVRGPGSLAFLQRVTSNDVARLHDGHAQYTALPRPNGAPVDDVVLYRFSAERYVMVVNAGNLDKDWAWLEAQPRAGCDLVNRSDEFALLALQGPAATAILQELTPVDVGPGAIGFYKFATGAVSGVPATIARTGYTGEDGFEIMIEAARGPEIWNALLARGAAAGLRPAGLAARDTLRLEAKMCLYGNDIDETTTLIEAGLGWIVSVEEHKGDFLGRPVLEDQKKNGVARRLVGFEMKDRSIARHGYPVWVGGANVSTVTSGTRAPFLEKNIGLAYLPVAVATPGTPIEIEIRGVRAPAEVVKTPFYKRPR